MPYALVRLKVEDYAKWKLVFDQQSPPRQAGGSQGARIFRNADDPNELVILFQWDDLEKLRQYAQSEGPQVRQRGGVTDQPDVYFLEEVEHVPA
jgi:heme-degrading monooxygenase HmoA